MRKTYLEDKNIKLVAKKNFRGKEKMIDYYLVTSTNDILYAFSKTYTINSYNLCKSGIRVNELVSKRSRDTGVMRLVKYLNIMVPYLAEEYELALA